MLRRPGFTLIELMIVVAIIGILAATAIPRFVDVLRKSEEGATRGNLGTLRSAVGIYYSDTEGTFPSSLEALTVGGRFLSSIPATRLPGSHSPTSAVLASGPPAGDGGGWWYDNAPSDANFGGTWVRCTHTDAKGTAWSAY